MNALSVTQSLLPRKKAAALLGVKAQTLAAWKCSGSPALPVVKVGSRAMYRQSDLDAFLAQNTAIAGEKGGRNG